MQGVINPSRPWGGGGGAGGGVILPANFAGNTTADLINPTQNPGLSSSGNPRSYGNPTGSSGENMTGPNTPAPYSVIGEQPNDQPLPSTGVKEWDAPAWGVFTTAVNRAYLNTYDYGNYLPSQQYYRRSVLADRVTLLEPRRITYVRPQARIHAYSIKGAYLGREPLGWNLHGSNSSEGPWTLLDTRSHTAGSLATNPLHGTAEGVFQINPALMPPEGFTHYRLSITKVNPPPSGGTGYIDLAKIAFYEAGVRIRSTDRAIPADTERVRVILRVGGRTGLTSADVSAAVSWDTSGASKAIHMTPVTELTDGTTLFAGDVTVTDLQPGTSLVAHAIFANNDIRLFGWNFGAYL